MSPASESLWLGALLLGFVGSGHCVGMCGGLAAALGQGRARPSWAEGLLGDVLISLGRLTTYALFGALLGYAGALAGEAVGLTPWARVLAGLLIVLFGLHTAGWDLGASALERRGLGLWRRVSPLLRRLGDPDRAWKLLAIGALWGWLPCGLVYSALAASAVTGSASGGAAFMFCFGLGTVPALLLASGAASTLGAFLRRRSARRLAGALLVLFGCWTIQAAVMPSHAGHAGDAGHAAQAPHAGHGGHAGPGGHAGHAGHAGDGGW